MSRLLLPSGTACASEAPSTPARTVATEDAVQRLLDALTDPECRGILGATREEALTASELSKACDLPLSTTYRKLARLTATGLLEDRTRVRQSGKHASEYTRAVDDVVISLGSRGETEMRVSQGRRRKAVEPPVPVVGD
jgi:DNA-binding transcriptional ArsR family regulator